MPNDAIWGWKIAYFPPLYQDSAPHLLQEELVGEYGHWEFDVATVEEVIGHFLAAPHLCKILQTGQEDISKQKWHEGWTTELGTWH